MRILAWVLRNTLYRNRLIRLQFKDKMTLFHTYTTKLGSRDVMYVGNNCFVLE